MKTSSIGKLAAGALALASLAWQSPAMARTTQEEGNLRVAIDFYNAVINEMDIEKALGLTDRCFIQHSIYAPDGARSLVELVTMLKRDYPQNRAEIVRAFVDGDTVALHVHEKRTPEVPGLAVIEVMRIKDGKVVEHWDMFQGVVGPLDPRRDPDNSNSVF